jgi:multidrug efflux pump subunit AcrB
MMNDETKYEVHPEIAKSMPAEAQEPEVQEEAVVEQQTAPKVEVPEEPIKKEDAQIAKSWREIRAAMKKAEQERDEALRMLRERDTKPHPQQQLPEEEINIGSDDLVEGKHLKAYNQKIKKLEEQLRLQQQQSYTETAKARLKMKFPDFESVVNQDSIDMLGVLQPEVAQTLNTSTDLYATGVTAYTMIKNLGIQSPDVYKQDIETAKKNMAKPRPLTSIAPQQGEGALSRANMFANGLTDDLKKQLYKEMTEAAKKN